MLQRRISIAFGVSVVAAMVRLVENLEGLGPSWLHDAADSGLTSPMATFSAHTASPPPPSCREFLFRDHDQIIRLISHRPVDRSVEEYESRDELARLAHNLSSNEQLLFLEIERTDSSEFEASLRVTGVCVGRYNILCASSPVVPNAIAAILIHIRDTTGRLRHVYFQWTEGNPIGHMFRFLVFGEGDVPPVTHEVLRHSVADPDQRPFVHLT